MRAHGFVAWTAGWTLCAAATLAFAQDASKAERLLALTPLQKGVDFDNVTDPAAIKACTVDDVFNDKGKNIGFLLRDGQGRPIRKLIDTRSVDKHMYWSYYQDGFEIYRDIDLDGDRRIDESRWMNALGTRHAVIVGGKIKAWKRISAEEASKVLTQAIVDHDLALLETVMATPEDLAALGLSKDAITKTGVAAEAGKRQAKLDALIASLKGWTEGKTVWLRFDGAMPHLIPADPENGLKDDALVYENGVIFAGLPNGQGDPMATSYLQAADLIKIGETWKFLALPRANDPKKSVVVAAQDAGFRMALVKASGPAQTGGGNAKEDAAKLALANFDAKFGRILSEGTKREQASYHVERIPLLRELIKATDKPDEALLANKQIADSLAAAYQTGQYPKGFELLDTLIKQGGKIGSYAAYRKILAEYASAAEDPGANPVAVQKKHLANLAEYLKSYEKSDEAPDVLLQLASIHEYNADDEEARKYYSQLAQDHPETSAGKKASGALRRFDLVGKSFELKGAGLKGEVVSTAKFSGKTVLVVFWASWAEPVKRDLPELIKTYNKYHSQGFEVVGVNLDAEKQSAVDFLAENAIPWVQIHEAGGMEGRLANEYGIISVPTMFLIDDKGKVASRNIRAAADLDRQLAKMISAAPGVAVGAKN